MIVMINGIKLTKMVMKWSKYNVVWTMILADNIQGCEMIEIYNNNDSDYIQVCNGKYG